MTELPTDYGPLMRELLGRAAKIRQPACGIIELTKRCNLVCKMCYTRGGSAKSKPKKRELTDKEWLAIIQQAVNNGMVFLLLTGGEVFLRPDFFKIYEPLTRIGLFITLFTNGTLITKDIAERLAGAPPNRTEITLYGATASTYEIITSIPGSYERCCSGIDALVSQRVPLVLKTTITRQNVAELEDMKKMAKNWGVPFYAGWLLSKRPDGLPSEVEECRLSSTDCIELEATDQASAHEWAETALRGSSAKKGDNFYCNAGKSSFVINPSGEMSVCIDLPQPAARPLEIGFDEAWKQVQRHVDSALPASSVCQSCDARVYCPRCPAWSYLETKTLTEPVPYLCEIARTRKDRYNNTELFGRSGKI